MKTNLIKLFIVFFALVTLNSCKKSTEDAIIAKWKGYESTIDGTTDQLLETFKSTYLQFYSDGTGVKTLIIAQPFTWFLTDNSLTIETQDVTSGSTTIAADTSTYKILNVDRKYLEWQFIENGDEVHRQTFKKYKD